MNVRTAILGLAVLGAANSAQAREEIYRDKYVVAEVGRVPVLLGNFHGDETVYLKVFGKTYKDVRGEEPFYIFVSELNSIVFVTQEGEEHATLHIVNVETKKVASVALGGLGFGNNIG